MKNDLILEIGAEEIPSIYFDSLLGQLKTGAENLFTENKIARGQIDVYATPRRLVIYCKDVADTQTAEEKKIVGPAKQVAFDENGKPTKALEGFLKTNSAALKDIEITKTPKGEYIFISKTTGTQPTAKILAKAMPGFVKSLSFPKVMHWDKGATFVRPVRWILSLYGNKNLNFEFADVRSSNFTYGLRPSKPLKVKDAPDYFKVMKKAGVLLDQNKRKHQMLAQLKKAAACVKSLLIDEPDLLESVNYLTEQPHCIAGEFKKEYLSLPEEVLSTSMAKKQKVFSVAGKDGRIKPFFLAILNGKVKNPKAVKNNYEMILEAKLSDSRFFYQEDTKYPLTDYVEKLKGVIYLKDLGTVYDKIQRLKNVCQSLSSRLNLSNDMQDKAQRTCLLCKADLVTQMVKEFPTLQGVMGKVYALSCGEDKDVAIAIQEHYMPGFSGDAIPKTVVGCLVAVADKIDLLVGSFGIGVVPTGSYDPYAQRRNATGLLRIILEKKLDISLAELMRQSRQSYKTNFKQDEGKLYGQLNGLFLDRLNAILLEQGYKFDLIDAVLSSGFDRPSDAQQRLSQLASIKESQDFQRCAKVVERTYRITKGAKEIGKVDPALFQEAPEKQLWDKYQESKGQIINAQEKKEYINATRLYGNSFYDIIHAFFDKVMVNVEDSNLRNNRLALCKAINQLYTDKIADLSKVVIESK